MELANYFKSIVDQDRCPVVICNLEHEIIYMNPTAAKRYGKYGGGDLVGRSLFDCHNKQSAEAVKKVVAWFVESKENNVIYTSHNQQENKDVYMVALRDEDGELIGYYEKHELRGAEERGKYCFE